MKRLRFWTIALSVWLIFFFNIERILKAAERVRTTFSGEVNLIQSYTYLFVALIIILILLLPKLRGPFFTLFMVFWVSLFLVLWYHLPVGRSLPVFEIQQVLTITVLAIIQISAIILTGLLVRQMNHALQEFEDVIADITFNHIGARPQPFLEAQGDMYRELKRARYYQRPLSVVALQVDEGEIEANIPKIVEDVQQAMMKEYALAKIARILDSNLYDFNAIALRDNCFVIILPETNTETVSDTIIRLEEVLKEEINITFQVGTASFPDQAVTFERLIERAIENIHRPEPATSATTPEALVLPSTKTQAVMEKK